MSLVNAIQHIPMSTVGYTDNDRHFCHTYHKDFSAEKPNILKKQPNFICFKLNFDQKPPKSEKPGFLDF